MEILGKRVKDQRFLELIRKALNAGYMQNNQIVSDIVGTPQGSIISPILANIFLHELDEFVQSVKSDFDAPVKSYKPRNKEALKAKYYIEKAKRLTDPIARRKMLKK